MGRQILWVLRTYLANKLFLAVLAFACLILAMVVARGMFDSKEILRFFIPLPWFAGIGPAALAGAVGGVLAMQFRNPASHLSPRFVRAHACVAALWLAGIVAGVTICTWTQSQQLLAGTLFSVGITGYFFGAGVGLAKPNSPTPTLEHSPLNTLLRVGMTIVAPLFLISFGGYLVFLFGGYISGVQPSSQHRMGSVDAWWIPCLLLVGIGVAWQACQTLRALAGSTSTSGNEAGRASNGQPSVIVSDRWLESFVANWNSAPDTSTHWNRVLRWRVGNPRLRTVLLITLGTLGMASFLLIPLTDRQQSTHPLSLAVYPMCMLFIVCIQVAFAWRKRLTCLDVESLRPIARAALEREWAAAVALDLIPPALTAAAIATLSVQLNDDWFSSIAWQTLFADWPEMLAMFVLLSGVLWLASLAFTAAITVIERLWLGLVVGLGAFLFGGLPFAALLGRLAKQTRSAPDPIAALPLMLIPVVVSAALAVYMWRLWTRIDFDRRS